VARCIAKTRPLIYVFCEGASEVVYTEYLKKRFSKVAVIEKPIHGLFAEADGKFKKEIRYRNYIDVTDEIWFFFDVEWDKTIEWNKIQATLKTLRNLRRKQKITIRLLMTTACIEYWLLLHFCTTNAPIQDKAAKGKIMDTLKQNYEPAYEKGDKDSTHRIAEKYKTAIANGSWTLRQLESLGLPLFEKEDVRNAWLYDCSYSFTTVHEAIEFLEAL
jgi:hypothetical protein